jgi:hypothetical protein
MSPRTRPKTVAFYEEWLGFKISDWLGHFMSFLCRNRMHHSIASIPCPPCLKPVADEIRDVNQAMSGAAADEGHGAALKWGPHAAPPATIPSPILRSGGQQRRIRRRHQSDRREKEADCLTARLRDHRSVAPSEGPQGMGKPTRGPALWQPPQVRLIAPADTSNPKIRLFPPWRFASDVVGGTSPGRKNGGGMDG